MKDSRKAHQKQKKITQHVQKGSWNLEMNDVSGESHSAISSFLRLSATGKVPGPKEVGLCRGTQGDIFL